ncbi:DUF2062 domain-containing protein [Luteolibacter sp. GHJ8]|jgi:uncharacterized protein (DUF2062 family)|uniref:DUF2062 domain-containing protein n=1 Tax=Luteolibacter rhizosphaerae TaxID=2989719 RepID=A0ABT3FYE4_9BACT|nr:DUF2062 domain-containing protein [Luteolibacter rhizosphaerae]MCW1912610.1 DUF2062 domain-containing protein [Luteolibacter rhizosphaerae]
MKRRYLWLVRRAYRALRHPRLRHREWWQDVTHALFERRLWMPCRDTVASGLAIGMFFAVMPVPLQMLFAGVAAMKFRANVPIAMTCCWLSNPVTNLPLFLGQFWLGAKISQTLGLNLPDIQWFKNFLIWLMGQESENERSLLDTIRHGNTGDFFLGALASGILLAALAYPLVHLFSAIMPHHLPARKHATTKVSSFMRKIKAQRDARKEAKKAQKEAPKAL